MAKDFWAELDTMVAGCGWLDDNRPDLKEIIGGESIVDTFREEMLQYAAYLLQAGGAENNQRVRNFLYGLQGKRWVEKDELDRALDNAFLPPDRSELKTPYIFMIFVEYDKKSRTDQGKDIAYKNSYSLIEFYRSVGLILQIVTGRSNSEYMDKFISMMWDYRLFMLGDLGEKMPSSQVEQ